MTVAVPLCPSLVAVMVTAPAVTPVISPLALTDAIVVLLLPQLIARPVSTLPPASFVVAVSCTVAPVAMLADGGLTVTEATGTVVTVTVLESASAPPFCLAITRKFPGAWPAV